MLESEMKKVRESIDALNDTVGALIRILETSETLGKILSPPPETADTPDTSHEKIGKGLEELMEISEVNDALSRLAVQMPDMGACIRTMMVDKFGSAKLSEIDPSRYRELVALAGNMVTPTGE